MKNYQIKNILKENQKYLKLKKILKKKKVGKQTFYKVKWVKYDKKESTWEPRSNLLIDIPDLVQEFENSLKK